MRRYTRTFVLLLVASLVIAVAPAASGGSHGLKATFEVVTTTVVPPGHPDTLARCGNDWPGWIFQGEAEGTLTVGKDTYDAAFTLNHCSKYHVSYDPLRTNGRQVGKSTAGEMTITTPDGELYLTYGGTWVMYDYEFEWFGDPINDWVPVEYTTDLKYSYAFEGGTNIFEDVSRGHGHIAMTVATADPPGTGWMAGSLK